MLIQCTKKLLDELGMKPVTVETEEAPLFSWHANVMTMGRKKTVVLSNDQNKYRVVLYGLKAKDFRKLDELITTAIRKTFQEEGIQGEVIDQYFEKAGEVAFTKTKNRTMVARLNRACEEISYFGQYLNEDSLYQPRLSRKVSSLLVGDGGNGYFNPNEVIYSNLKEMASREIFDSKAAVLKVTLVLEKHEVWRKLVVPVHYTFSQLHEVIQTAFGWGDEHLHEFYILGSAGSKPIMNLVCDEESFEYRKDIPMKLEKGVELSEYVPARIKYIYDFGDHWEHDIVVENEMDHYDNNHPICLDGKGNTPPEDVGGDPGYEEFLKIITDKQHPEHQTMVHWGREQGFNEFNIQKVNSMLKR